MSVQLDPEGTETARLHEVAGDWSGHRVLEVGCGDGRLTWRYAESVASVLGIDPVPEYIERARQACPPHLAGRVEFQAGSVLDYTLPADAEPFDTIILAWSLC